MPSDIFNELKIPEAKIDTAICREWKKTHSNCKGCPSEKACRESVARYGQFVTSIVNEEEGTDLDLDWG